MLSMAFDFSGRDIVMAATGLATGFAAGLVGNIFFRKRKAHSIPTDSDSEGDDPVASASSPREEYKLVLCVRTDLKMQKGKIAAQVGHATLGAFKRAKSRHPVALRHWETNAQPKIALQVTSQQQANDLEAKAKQLGLVTYMVYDAGRTQIAAVCSTS